jgi:ABC-type branched-subunit amino acid transport system ATPase component/ABC-type branched-subunit amino acid transport system permease subunit
MSSDRLRALTAALAPSGVLLAIAIVGLLFDTYWQYVVAISMTAAVIGSALAMLVGYARCISIATGAMMAIGAYGATLPIVHASTPFLAAVVVAALLGACAGWVLGVPGVRFRSHNLAMITLVFQAVVIIVLRESKTLTGGAEGMHVPAPVILGMSFAKDADFLLLCGALYALAVIPMTVLLAGAFGKNLRALAFNENAARSFGINVNKHLIAAFIFSSALIAFTGAVSAPRFRIIDPDSYGILTSIFTLAYPIIGGMGSIWGGLAGGGILRVIPELLRPLADYIELIFCGLVVVTLTFFPEGLASAFWRRSGRRSHARRGASLGTHEIKLAPITELFAATAAVGPAAAGPRGDDPILAMQGISKSYGALRAVDDVSLTVAPGALHGLMGPNGAGKTTLFNIVSGFVAAETGHVRMSGALLDHVQLEDRIGLGMTRTFQHAAVFERLSCLDNVIIGLGRNSVAQSVFRGIGQTFASAGSRNEQRAAAAALTAVGLGARRDDLAGMLPLGDQRRLEIARAIVSRPRIMLLDEPVSGVSVEEARKLRELLLAINGELGIAMVVIEHNIRFLSSLCRRISVMSQGRILAEGDAASIIADPRVRNAYFGEQEVAA